jgi:hypothetical protein
MAEKEEGYLKDYIAAGLVGFGVGTALAGIGTGGLGIAFSFLTRDWGKRVADFFVAGLFAFLPGGFFAGYFNFRMHRPEVLSAEGLRAGFMAFLAHFFVTLFMTVARTAIWSANFSDAMQLWAVSFAFALIFYTLGGFLASLIESNKTPLPSFLKFSFAARAGAFAPPPPPPSRTSTCPTCGGQLTYIPQYQRWYCYKCQKYA